MHKPGELYEKSKRKKNWIQGAIKPGGLHRSLGIAQGKKIPAKKIAAAAKKGGKVGRQARLAQTLKGLRKGKKKNKLGDAIKTSVRNITAGIKGAASDYGKAYQNYQNNPSRTASIGSYWPKPSGQLDYYRKGKKKKRV